MSLEEWSAVLEMLISMRVVFLIGLVFFVNACSVQPQKPLWISQNTELYTKSDVFVADTISEKEYGEKYFRAWHIQTLEEEKREMNWALKIYTPQNSYGENLQKREQSFFDTMQKNLNTKAYASVNKKALTLKNCNIRALPTMKPILLNPNKAGEGFPFDYLQNSSIAANKPVFVTHYSKDRAWVHIISSFTYGWVKASDVVMLTEGQAQEWENKKHIFITQDNTFIYTPKSDFLYKARVGMMLPYVKENDSSYRVLVARKSQNLQSPFLSVNIPKKSAHLGKLAFTSQNINTILKQLHKSKYGWGGIYRQRDCSSTLRDFFAPFGIWLPRNSSKQSKVGEVVDLSKLTDKQKIKLIQEKALPFRTLLYKKGHIVLYVGGFKNQVIVFQNMWGIKTKKAEKEGRYIVGKALFSTLNFGKNLENYDKSVSFIHKLQSMNILF